MYVAVLNTQKSVLQEDAEKLRKELHDGNFLWKLLDELKKWDALWSHITAVHASSHTTAYLRDPCIAKARVAPVIKMFWKHFTNKRLSKIVNYFRLTLETCFFVFFSCLFFCTQCRFSCDCIVKTNMLFWKRAKLQQQSTESRLTSLKNSAEWFSLL